MQFWSIRVILSRLKAIRFMMADKTVPKTKKALIIAGIAYLFLPLDLIRIVKRYCKVNLWKIVRKICNTGNNSAGRKGNVSET